MPFERYLRADDRPIDNNIDLAYPYHYRHACDDPERHCTHGQHPYLPATTRYGHHPHGVQFQIPQFMLNGPPILAPGGGAEVFPAGLLESGSDSFASSWVANNGFASFHSALISRQIGAESTPPGSSSTAGYHTFPHESRHLRNPPHRLTANVDSRQQPLLEQPLSLEVPTTYIPDLASSSPSTPSFNTTSYALSNALVPDPVPALPIPAPSALGLPVYSASGFDVLSILSRVVSRPNPTIQLGPVDLSCSFVIVDVRRYDCPIVYASPTFCDLTGYREQEVLGRNCRFLQSPTGKVTKGELRCFVSPEAVSHMRKLLSSSKECQTTLVNYRKDGRAFINLVSVIPLRGGVHNKPEEADEVAYHIGFQVDLTEQPSRILDKLRDGSYCVNGSPWGTSNVASNAGFPDMTHGFAQLTQSHNMTNIGPKGGRHGQMMSLAVSKELRNLIADTTFTDFVSISTGTNMSGPTGALSGAAEQGGNATTPLTMLVAPPHNSTSMSRSSTGGNTMTGSIPASLSPSLSLLLLEFLPDFLLVLSLKGAFLYVAPSVRLVLGYEPQELVGRSISDICHPADLVPLMRELKEGSMSGLGIPGTGDAGPSTGSLPNPVPKSVDLLFRALPRTSTLSQRRGSQIASVEQGDSPASQSSPASAPQSSPSSGTSYSSDLSDGTTPPYVWLECRGRLHVEPGKGRKAIILSGRARWMPVVRWSSVDKASGVASVRRQGDDVQSSSRTTAGSRPSGMSPWEAAGAGPIDPLDFWSLVSSQGTFLVASASVRDVLGWGTSELIGRNLWAMVRDSRGCMRERVEAELGKLDTLEVTSMADPPPTVVTTSLVHKDLHVVPIRLVFYRTPPFCKHAPASTSTIGVASTPLVHPLNNPLCPIVCHATVLSNTDHQSSNNDDASLGPGHGHALSQVQIQTDTENDMDEPSPSIPHSDASLFEELDIARGSSWQYELQQLKFANQRLHEELNALEAARASGGALPPSSSTFPQRLQLSHTRLHHTPQIRSAHSPSGSSLRLPNSLHEQDLPFSEWSSLAGANGQGLNPLKRSWRSEDDLTT